MRIIAMSLALLTGCSFFQSPAAPKPPDPPVPAAEIGWMPRDAAAVPVPWQPAPSHPQSPIKRNVDAEAVVPEPPSVPPPPAAFADLIPYMEAIARSRPEDASLQVKLAALYALDDKYEQAQAVFERLPEPAGGDSWHRLDLIHRSMRWIVMRNLGIREADAEFEKMSAAIARAHGMQIAKAVLCTRVQGYEDFELKQGNRFNPGEQALLYLQVRNFDLIQEDGVYRFHLKYRWQLIDQSGQDRTPETWTNIPPDAREDRRTLSGPRTEFWQTFALPSFPVRAGGLYTIRISVIDAMRGNHSQFADIPIEMGDFTPPPRPK